ncbi:MAG: guanylate kinase [Elusimicrobia bacterium]|nr:guanylate kinase [Elusimicrobiota bacterium]
MRTGFLVIISAPSGAGKSSVCRALRARDGSLRYSVSATTRAPRPGEKDGRHYHFLTREEFRRRVRRGDFLEWAEVHGNLYGTPKGFIEKETKAGRVILLDIDVQGAAQIVRKRSGDVTLFILPPSWKTLELRLRHRRDTNDSIRTRLTNARLELKEAPRYQYWVVNDRLERAVGQAAAIIRAERLRSCRQAPRPIR